MAKPIFISFRYAEKNLRNDLVGLFKPDITFDLLDESHVQRVESELKAEIQRRIRQSKGVIVLVGDTAHNSPWLDYEIRAAQSMGLPCLAIQHPNSTGGLPNAHKNLPTIKWDRAVLREQTKSW